MAPIQFPTSRASLLALLVAIALGQVGAQAPHPENPGDYLKVEEENPNLATLQGRDLHQRPRLPDGSKGYTVIYPVEGNWGPGAEELALYDGRTEDVFLHHLACSTDAVVIGSLVASTPHLSEKKTTISTRYHFNVDRVLSAAAGTLSADSLDVIQLGGYLTDQGEKLSVRVAGAPQFQLNQAYLLFLDHDKRAAPNVFLSPDSLKFRVSTGRIYAIAPANHAILSSDGESVEEFSQRLSTLLNRIPCAR